MAGYRALDPPKPPARWLNRDGTLNVLRKGLKRLSVRDLYHSTLAMSWPTFLMLTLAGYLLVNALFALGYMLCGPGALEGAVETQGLAGFQYAFFFSVQTLATIGYGKITPVGLPANLLVTLEALTGLLGIALSTGLLFSRFSRPTARVVFSRVALIGPHDGEQSLLFRMSNERLNQILEVKASVVLIRTELTREGESYRNLIDLKLERSRTPIFSLTWTAVHPIDEASPLHGMSYEDLVDQEVELIVSLVGIDATFAQTIHARYSYSPEDLRWNRQFVDILHKDESGNVLVDMERIHDLKDLKDLQEIKPEAGA